MYTKGESGWVVEHYAVKSPGRDLSGGKTGWIADADTAADAFARHTWPVQGDMGLAAFYDAEEDTFTILGIAFHAYVCVEVEIRLTLPTMDNPLLVPLWRKLASVQGWSLGQGEQGTNEGNDND